MVNRHQQAIGFDQFVEDILQNVFDIRRVWHLPADEISQPGLLPLDDLRDPLILLRHGPVFSQRLVHLLVKTNERDEYCMLKVGFARA